MPKSGASTDDVLRRFESIDLDVPTKLESKGRFTTAWHLWTARERDALIFALATNRPLLIRGEAGCGKSQIARAAAAVSGGALICEVIHPRFEATDLLYTFDVVSRLADAHAGALDSTNKRYVKEGVLWQAIDATNDAESKGLPVVLIDEIDKADSDLPNSLLDVLGNRSFSVPPRDGLVISAAEGRMPLIIITTNEERELPPAFIRRCGVLNLNPPDDVTEGDGRRFKRWLTERGRVHSHLTVDETVRAEAADLVLEDRKASLALGYAKVGLAEYVDLLVALSELGRDAPDRQRRTLQRKWMKRLRGFALQKNASQQADAASSTEPESE